MIKYMMFLNLKNVSFIKIKNQILIKRSFLSQLYLEFLMFLQNLE
jgi:hypothetical protein